MRYESERFKFDVENYLAAGSMYKMKHIRIYCEGAMQVDLWLTEDDVRSLGAALEDCELRKEK